MFALDGTGIRLGNVLVVATAKKTVHIGVGQYQNDNTPFYVDTLGRFSLGANLSWDPGTTTLAITGTIIATSGSIGGFDIGADYIRDAANSFGMVSAVTAGDDVRFWAGNTFANRAIAPLRITESGAIVATSGAIGGFTLSATTLTANSGTNYITINSSGSMLIQDASGSFPNCFISAGSISLTASVIHNDFLTVDHSGLSFGGFMWGTTTINKSTIDFNGDTNLYRSAANVLETDDNFIAGAGIDATVIGGTTPAVGNFTHGTFYDAVASDIILKIRNTDTGAASVGGVGFGNDATAFAGYIGIVSNAGGGTFNVVNINNTAMLFQTNNTLAMTVAVGGNLTIVGAITTAKPATGNAGAWKLGQYTAGVAVQAGKVRVNVDSVDYDLLTA